MMFVEVAAQPAGIRQRQDGVGIGRCGLGGARLADASGGSVWTTAYSSAARVLLAANGRLPVHRWNSSTRVNRRRSRHGWIAGDLFWRRVFERETATGQLRRFGHLGSLGSLSSTPATPKSSSDLTVTGHQQHIRGASGRGAAHAGCARARRRARHRAPVAGLLQRRGMRNVYVVEQQDTVDQFKHDDEVLACFDAASSSRAMFG